MGQEKKKKKQQKLRLSIMNETMGYLPSEGRKTIDIRKTKARNVSHRSGQHLRNTTKKVTYEERFVTSAGNGHGK